MSLLSPAMMAAISWRHFTPSSPLSSKTMSSLWSTWGITSDHSKAWTTGRYPSLLWRMLGTKIWQTSWKTHSAQKLPKVDYTLEFYTWLIGGFFPCLLCSQRVSRTAVSYQRNNEGCAGIPCWLSVNKLTNSAYAANTCRTHCHKVPWQYSLRICGFQSHKICISNWL